MPRQSLIEDFTEYTRRRNEPAITSFSGYHIKRWTYGRIADEACRFARELETRGVNRGDAVLLWGNCPEWLAAFWGCLLRGVVVVPIDHISTAEFASRVAQSVKAKLLVCSRAIPAEAVALPALPIESLCETIARHSAAQYASPQLSRTDTLEIVFTSRDNRGASGRRDFTRERPRKYRTSGN